VIIGVLIAITLELSGVASLPFAVGVYLPLAASTPIFVGGAVRWMVDRFRHRTEGSEDDSSPAVLLSSGYIAGGAIAAVLISFLNFTPGILNALQSPSSLLPTAWSDSMIPASVAFLGLAVILLWVGLSKKEVESSSSQG
jgi:hypothetical protein